MRFLAGVIVCVVLLISFSAAQLRAGNSPIDLSLQTAILFALHENSEILSASEAVNQARYAIDEAKAGYYPQIDLLMRGGSEYNNPAASAEGGTGKSNVNNSAEITLFLEQYLFDGMVTIEEVRKRKELAVSSQYEKELTQEEIIIDTINAYLSLFQYQETLVYASGFLEQIERVVDKIALMEEAGAESKARLKFAQARLAFAKSEVTSASSSLSDAVNSLEFLTGPLPPFRVNYPRLLDIPTRDLKEYFEQARAHNVNLHMAESDRKALVHEFQQSRGEYLPKLTFQLEMTQSHDIGGEVGRKRSGAAMLQMDYKFFGGFARKAGLKRSISQVKEAEYDMITLAKEIRQSIQESYNEIKSLENQLYITEEEIIANRQLQQLYREQFELGEGDIINLIQGEERLYAAQAKKAGIESEIALNTFVLIQQIGYLDKHNFCKGC